jgi:hypothetical protein
LARGDSAGIEHTRRLKSGLPYERSWVAAELSCKAECVQTEPFLTRVPTPVRSSKRTHTRGRGELVEPPANFSGVIFIDTASRPGSAPTDEHVPTHSPFWEAGRVGRAKCSRRSRTDVFLRRFIVELRSANLVLIATDCDTAGRTGGCFCMRSTCSNSMDRTCGASREHFQPGAKADGGGGGG